MKHCKILVTCLFMSVSFWSLAQNETQLDERKGKFKRENIFLGSGLNLGLANTSFTIGVNPEVGYSLTNWLDAGVALNINYFSQNASDYNPDRVRNFSYGGGTFLRIWPVNFLHVQIQPEYNWTNSSLKNVFTNQTIKQKFNAESLLVGIGYGSRIIGGHYSYLTLMIDVFQNIQSPYRDQFNDPLPVFRAGFGIYLKPRRQ